MKRIYASTQSLVNFSNTILAHFQTPTHHPVIPSLLKVMAKHDHLCVLLFDGMGQTILRQHLSPGAWLRKHRWGTITSTFPSTTAAATNALLSGKYPIEIGWFGWAQYFKEHDRILELFTGKDYLLQQPFLDPSILRKSIEYPSIFEQIQQHHPEVKIEQVWPEIRPDGAKTIEEFYTRLDAVLAKQNGKQLTYAYWLDPDKSIHKLGVGHPTISAIVQTIQTGLKQLCETHPKTLFLVFADHGLIDIEFLSIQQHADLFNTLMRSFALEPRAATFYVRPNQTDLFKKLFKRYYGKHFLLFTQEEVLKHEIYGIGQVHPRFKDFVGDFVAISKSKYAFTHGIPTDTMPKNMKAHHAGMTKKEMLIDVMVMNR